MISYKKIYIKKNDGTILDTILQSVDQCNLEINGEEQIREITNNIPFCEENSDYQKYLQWKSDGGLEIEENYVEENSY